MVQLGELVCDDGSDIIQDLWHEELELNDVMGAESNNSGNSGENGNVHEGSSGENQMNTSESFFFIF